MRVIQFASYGGPEALTLAERETPAVGPQDVLIQVARIGVNYSDLLFRRGAYPGPVTFPVVTGNEAAGIVAAVGSGVEHLQIGQRVAAWLGTFQPGGGYVDELVTSAGNVVAIPKQLSYEQALAGLQQGLTAYFLLERAKVQPPLSVLVHAGAGGVGSLAIQLAKLRGATVLGMAKEPQKLDLMRSLGANAVLSYDQDWETAIKALLPHGVDVILDSVGGQVGKKSLALLAPLGRQLVYGAFSGSLTEVSPVQMMQVMWQNQSVMGFVLQTILQGEPGGGPRAIGYLYDQMAKGRLRVVAQHSFPFERAAEAHRAIEERRTSGKVVLTVTRRHQ